VHYPAGDGFEFFFAEDFPRDGKEDIVLFVDVVDKNPDDVFSCRYKRCNRWAIVGVFSYLADALFEFAVRFCKFLVICTETFRGTFDVALKGREKKLFFRPVMDTHFLFDVASS
jgi:hypothetical protein